MSAARRKQIIQVLKDAKRPLTPLEVGRRLGVPIMDVPGLVTPILRRLKAKGKAEVVLDPYGRIKARHYTWVH